MTAVIRTSQCSTLTSILIWNPGSGWRFGSSLGCLPSFPSRGGGEPGGRKGALGHRSSWLNQAGSPLGRTGL